MNKSILKSDQPNILKQKPPADDPWGNTAENPYRQKQRIKRLIAEHLAHNGVVTALQAQIEELQGLAKADALHIENLDDVIAELKQDLKIAEGKVAEKAKASSKKSKTKQK